MTRPQLDAEYEYDIDIIDIDLVIDPINQVEV